ncbi:HEAT repeat domain-containing protein [Micromonospora coxensis]|uniref:Uncharacterized protein n=1 Tax=Micromonospora coxensis TaxID=356852 RepID=A0A1C5JD48_9ACTN|nr:hypothetical protein [Micromonospora coxensis]SCG67956.1 hypothetical protein GA0070614_4322 [Micromonospora coxensis]
MSTDDDTPTSVEPAALPPATGQEPVAEVAPEPATPPPPDPGRPAPADAGPTAPASPTGTDTAETDDHRGHAPALEAWKRERQSGDAAGEAKGEDESWTNEASDERGGGGQGGGSTFRNVGQTVYGDHAMMFNFQLPDGRQITVLRSQRTEASLREAETTYVTVEGFAEARRQLEERRVLLLRGTAGTGRRTTAELLLAGVVGFDRVVGIENTDAGVTLTQLAGQDGLLVEGHGTVLELPAAGAVGMATLRIFEKLAHDAGAYVVIVEDREDSPDPALAPYTFAHRQPPVENVLGRHLLRLLTRAGRCLDGCTPCSGECRTRFVARCLAHDRVRTELFTHPQPAPTVELARSLAGWSGVDEELEDALGGLSRHRRDFAARLLSAAGDPDDPLETPRRRSFQIAYATFHSHPLTDVFDAGELLLGILRAVESGSEQTVRVVFDGGVEQLLRTWSGEPRLATVESGEQPRRALLADPRLLLDVLDVVWNDFDGVRLPLLFWLDRLVLGPRAAVRRRAAEVTGWLATYDFDEVCNTMIRRWAADGRGTVRQAAAWALDVATADPRLLGRIRGRVRDWVRSSDPLLHDTAARAYGTRIGQLAPEEAVQELRTLASRKDLNASASVARTLVTLYGVAPEVTWQALVTWSGDGLQRLRVHAARGLTLLAGERASPPEETRPLLLTATGAFTPDHSELVALWQTALADPTTAFRAWKELHGWIRLADDGAALADLVVDLVGRMLVGRIAARGRFHLREWSPGSATARRLYGPGAPGGAAAPIPTSGGTP